MFCRYCGKQVPEESAFCQHCGNQLGVCQQTAASQPKAWERMTMVINFRRGEAGWVAEEAYTAPVAQQSFWNDAQALIQEVETMAADEGWQPLGRHGPACVELEKYKSTEGHNRLAMALGAVATYGGSLLFARSWKFTAKSITLRWRRPATANGSGERVLRFWYDAKIGEWEPWQFDKARNKWVLVDEEDDARYSGTHSRGVQPLAAQHTPALTEEEKNLLGLWAEGYSDKHIEYRLGKPGLDVNGMALHLCGKLGAKSKAELIQRAREMGLLVPDATG
jgi:DNA-binding CsgD family transcriptional regulator